MQEVVEFVSYLMPNKHFIQRTISYAEALREVTKLDVFSCSINDIKRTLLDNEIDVVELDTKDAYLDCLMSLLVIPKLSQSVDKVMSILCIHSYPVSQAALAQELLDDKQRSIAARFEVVINGIEIANGYQECQDVKVLEERFLQDNLIRRDLKKTEMSLDINFLNAHKYGLPQCSGVALGVDRLCMLALDKKHINEVLTFPVSRC